MFASASGLLLSLAVLAAEEPRRPANPREYGFLLPMPILQQLELTAQQRMKVLQAGRKAQDELAAVQKKAAKLRDAFEPTMLGVLTARMWFVVKKD